MSLFKFNRVCVSIGWILFTFGVLFPVNLFSQNENQNISDFGFLAGSWEMSVPERGLTITEHWMKPLGGAMIGMGRTVAGGKMRSWESLRIVQNKSGIEYIAKPSQKGDETSFKLKTLSKTEVIFENLDNDFPQRIIYRLIDENSLTARIEGSKSGADRGMDIPMKRIPEPKIK